MRIVVSGVVGIVLGTALLMAQTPPAKPGPEHKRIERMVGQWTYEGEAKASPLGPAGKITASETCELFQGGFAVVCRSKGTGPKGPATSLGVMGYDTDKKMYTYYSVSSMGDNMFVRGHLKGNVWTFEDTAEVEGKMMKFRATVTEDSPTASTFKLEAGPADGQMMIIEEGKSKKVK
jgi:hypothetical protein